MGGRPAAVGGAYSALAEDAYAPVWNPGGLGFARGTQLATMHLTYLDSMNYEFLSVTRELPKGLGGLGAGVQFFRTGGIAGTDATGAPISDFGGHYAAYSLAYGKQVTPKASFGVTGKLLDARIGEVSGRGYGLDMGALYKMDERLSLAGVLANVGSRIRFLEEQDRLPATARAGATYWPFPRKMNFSLEGVYADGEAGVRSGIEVTMLQMVSVRAGVDTTMAADKAAALGGGLTMGVGFHFAGQEFDYAWVPRGDLGSTNYFSIVLRFSGQARPAAESAPAPAAPAPEEKKGERPQGQDYDESQTPPSPPLLWLDN